MNKESDRYEITTKALKEYVSDPERHALYYRSPNGDYEWGYSFDLICSERACFKINKKDNFLTLEGRLRVTCPDFAKKRLSEELTRSDGKSWEILHYEVTKEGDVKYSFSQLIPKGGIDNETFQSMECTTAFAVVNKKLAINRICDGQGVVMRLPGFRYLETNQDYIDRWKAIPVKKTDSNVILESIEDYKAMRIKADMVREMLGISLNPKDVQVRPSFDATSGLYLESSGEIRKVQVGEHIQRVDDAGEKVDCEVLAIYECEETHKEYLFFKYGEPNEEEQVKVGVSSIVYEGDEDGEFHLNEIPKDADYEWELIYGYFNKILGEKCND